MKAKRTPGHDFKTEAFVKQTSFLINNCVVDKHPSKIVPSGPFPLLGPSYGLLFQEQTVLDVCLLTFSLPHTTVSSLIACVSANDKTI